MAAAVTATVFLFLFTLSSARLPLDQPKNDFISADPSLVSLPDSDPKPAATILFPSERQESESATFVDNKPEENQLTDSKSHKKEIDEEKSVSVSDSQTDLLPLTTVFTLRPVNRQFFRVPLFPIRRGFKCHGHRRRSFHHINQLKQRFNGQREISFGNDMILAKGEDRGSDSDNYGEGQIPERWAKFHNGGQRFSLTNDDTIRQEMYRVSHAHPHFHHHHRHHRRHHRDEDEEDEEEEHRHEHGSGIMRSIRKFLNF